MEEKGTWLFEVPTMPDRVHLLVEVDPHYGLHKLVRASKARSTQMLGEEYPWLRSRLPSLGTNSHFVATGRAGGLMVKRYVDTQKGR
ncbi:IS200/IS605 family transposase [Mycolicibacterium celeriflavum]|uniref:Uncharacterized protein n=1 Tax=Mycolicibacterium celeriflavum TaxID=1249101 RepID=A0A1X0BPK3_MYCCF|nr:IS200/IS605 family transposase [Mycolicibacterium celeriflavum]BBY46287.1 hypothetical protein MCEL_45820 [Mycolicibacterium celeriflavum]